MLDQEKTLVLVAVGVVAAVGFFVLWGPNPHRSNKRKGQVIGLVNLGHTCFLNTLLQALASCPTFFEWLMERDETCRMAVTLRKVLQILNGISPDPIVDPYAPNDVITTLRLQGWQITPGEQDAHELFLILLDVLEEEFNQTSPQNGCLSHALILREGGDSLEINSLSSSKLVVGEMNDTKPILRKCRILQLPAPVPFRGMLSSQLKCSLCGFKSALRFDKIDTLSLALPSIQRGRLTLHQLLESFVKTETIPNVVCDHCSANGSGPVRTTAYKTLNFGKLPKVLCIHIARTTLNGMGQPCKREDYVDFEEYIAMDDFTHNHRFKAMKAIEKFNETSSHGGGEMRGERVLPKIRKTTFGTAKHLYRLKALVEHVGDIHSGHFVTFRKGLLHSTTRHRTNTVEVREKENASQLNREDRARWYYTSDSVVRPSTLCEALQARAYMLFYEKCTYSSFS